MAKRLPESDASIGHLDERVADEFRRIGRRAAVPARHVGDPATGDDTGESIAAPLTASFDPAELLRPVLARFDELGTVLHALSSSVARLQPVPRSDRDGAPPDALLATVDQLAERLDQLHDELRRAGTASMPARSTVAELEDRIDEQAAELVDVGRRVTVLTGEVAAARRAVEHLTRTLLGVGPV